MSKLNLCENCETKATCDVLKIYQVVAYGCSCLEHKPVAKSKEVIK